MDLNFTSEVDMLDDEGNTTGETREAEFVAEVNYTPGRPPPPYRTQGDSNYCDPGDPEELEVLGIWRVEDGERVEQMADDYVSVDYLLGLARDECESEEDAAAESAAEARAEARADRERDDDRDDYCDEGY